MSFSTREPCRGGPYGLPAEELTIIPGAPSLASRPPGVTLHASFWKLVPGPRKPATRGRQPVRAPSPVLQCFLLLLGGILQAGSCRLNVWSARCLQ